MSLTVCIPTVPSRRSLLSRLLWTLTPQYADEVLIAGGERPMGDKINEMFAAATTRFVVVVDDDDLVTDNYTFQLGLAVMTHVDFIGYRIVWQENGRYAGSVAHRGDGDTTWSTLDRGLSPKCPIRTELARAHEFGNHYTADREWSAAVQADVETHEFIDADLYLYDHWDAHMLGTTPDAGRLDTPQRDVGMWPYDREAFTWL